MLGGKGGNEGPTTMEGKRKGGNGTERMKKEGKTEEICQTNVKLLPTPLFSATM